MLGLVQLTCSCLEHQQRARRFQRRKWKWRSDGSRTSELEATPSGSRQTNWAAHRPQESVLTKAGRWRRKKADSRERRSGKAQM